MELSNFFDSFSPGNMTAFSAGPAQQQTTPTPQTMPDDILEPMLNVVTQPREATQVTIVPGETQFIPWQSQPGRYL